MADKEYNNRPSNWQEITEDEFRKMFFSYCFKKNEFRQIQYDEKNLMQGLFDTKLFDLDYDINLGIAIVNDWKEKKIKYFKYGLDDWNEFNKDFARQFQNDNS